MEVPIGMKICHFLTFQISQFKLIRYLLQLHKILLAFFTLVQSVFFLNKFELSYFIQYGPIYFILLYATACFIFQPLTESLITTYARDVQVWRIKEAPSEIQKKFSRTCLWVTTFMIVSLVFGAFAAIFFIVPTKADNDLIYIFNLVKISCGEWGEIVVWIMRPSTFVVVFVGMLVPAFTLLYYLCLIDLQKQMMVYHIRDFRGDHDAVTKKLAQYLARHIDFKKNMSMCLDKAGILVFPFQVISITFLASVVVFYFEFEGLLSDQYFRIAGLLVSGFWNTTACNVSGQSIEDFSVDVLKALDEVEWYDWSQKNKKTYLILLMNTAPLLRIKSSEAISVNYSLALKIVRNFFSVISVVYNLKQSG